MKISLNEVRGMQVGLDVILAKELPIKPAYWLARFLDKIRSEMEAMEKARVKLLEKLAKKDKDGKPLMKKAKEGEPQIEPQQYDLTDENMAKFQEEYNELGKEEFEIDFKPIKLDQLGDISLKPIVLVQLGKLIEE